ncbi:DNA-processing protein DprA [Mycoplasma crocodyli]|uniref:DNA uptake protein, SMF family n=1 Tax=Mycoplasma crocodyli (strain ATCC 51981 / MP145) TaxID=512564 RepID=D5E612_MYCCM|nr:DNA-processing protein DprA [Mycoplasma crocodyli]ADE19883.1 DNA uptake protein, SMF family [Mycoplasma crocodyli MP145]
MNDYLLYYSWLNNGDNFKVFMSIKNTFPINNEKLKEIKEYLKEKDIKYVTFMDSDYPEKLLIYKYPPYILFYKGDYELIKKQNIYCLTGDIINEKSFEQFIINKDVVINNIQLITNNFKGFDERIVEEYKKFNKPIIRIFANGFCWNDELNTNNEVDNDLWISQYPPLTHPKIIRFKERNLLLAALSNELIVFSSKKESKIFNLAGCFVNIGKEVNCFPGIEIDDGNNLLIKEGANLITSISDVACY